MKKLFSLLLVSMIVFTSVVNAEAQAPTPPHTHVPGTQHIWGDMAIKYNSRAKPGEKGVTDQYAINVCVSDSVLYRGTITHTPFIQNTFSANQNSSLLYDVGAEVVHPSNRNITKPIGRIYGTVPIASTGAYMYGSGNLKIVATLGSSNLEGKFDGIAQGKPLAKAGLIESLKKEAINLTKTVNGKTVAIAVTKYDKMTFENHKLAAGPVPIYTTATANGTMLYDYTRTAWHFQNVSISYAGTNGVPRTDRITGSIRWMEGKNRKATGEGFYEFDVRVNEPIATETAVFTAAQDEAAFFATDTSVASLIGQMKYKDTFSGESVIASAITLDLKGNQLDKQQTMNLCKLLVFSSIVPMNAE